MEVADINSFIEINVNCDIIDKLTDKKLFPEYIKCLFFAKKMTKLKEIIKKYVNDVVTNSICVEFTSEIIPAGIKGNIRGKKFNDLVSDFIENLNLPFQIETEKMCPNHETSEIPDWYIYDEKTGKAMIGMNQIDLWSGGQQSNRGSKYVTGYVDKVNEKLVCVVCNNTKVCKKNSKKYKLFNVGINKKTLCYVGESLRKIIFDYFGMI